MLMIFHNLYHYPVGVWNFAFGAVFGKLHSQSTFSVLFTLDNRCPESGIKHFVSGIRYSVVDRASVGKSKHLRFIMVSAVAERGV